MNVNQRKRQLSKGLTALLALLLTATLCITVVAFSAGRKNRPGNSTATSSATTKKTVVSTTKATATRATAASTTASTAASTRASTEQTAATTASTGTVTPPVSVEIPDFITPVAAGSLCVSYSADIPVFSSTMGDYRIHSGVDIAADAGTPVLAAAAGTVKSVYFDPMMGQTVVLTHKNGYETVYRNLQTVFPDGMQVGKTVEAGEQIGAVGDTALTEIATSPHLHFEVLKNEANENPLSYISLEKLPSESFEDE